MYGKRKAIAKRTPLSPPGSNIKDVESSINPSNQPLQPDGYTPIPAIPKGIMGTDAEEPGSETEVEELLPKAKNMTHSRHQQNLSVESTTSSDGGHVENRPSTDNQSVSSRPWSAKVGTRQKRKALSQHDLLNKYFRRDALVLRNVDLLR